ncbi:MAG TPA: hypothetical protein VFD25_03885 [Clostridia bacterium]|nr:hypothetical protein [Clostridia bacterium]
MISLVKATGIDPDTPETQNLPHPRAFSVLPYGSIGGKTALRCLTSKKTTVLFTTIVDKES